MSEPVPIIGGMFGLDFGRPRQPTPAFLTGSCLRLASARSAFTALVRLLKPPHVWLPSYLCEVVPKALCASPSPIRFYEVDEGLRRSDLDWLQTIRSGDMAVFIDYFGFRWWDECGREARAQGAWIVEDACQALLNERFSIHSHYVVLSPRKFFGVPDGGILRACDAPLPPANADLPSPDWWLDALAASHLRAAFDRQGGPRHWFDLFQQTDAEAPVEPYRMSDLTGVLLTERLDTRSAARIRRENYSFLAKELGDFALFPDLPLEVVPLGFPVRLHERDRVRSELFAAEIYPPVHWAVPDLVPDACTGSRRLASQIMTLPCDQRYGIAEMTTMVRRFRAAYPHPAVSAPAPR